MVPHRVGPEARRLGKLPSVVLLAPHLENQGGGNTAWADEVDGAPLLFAQRHGAALALACSIPWSKRSVGC